MQNIIKTEDIKGFRIVLSAEPEDMDPRLCWFEDQDIEDIRRKIDNGTYLWFVARVEAYRHGVLLASDYLGGCLYESFEDFLQEGGYYEDMVHNVTTAAQSTLARLGRPVETV
jgi:hypothetical protein